MIEGRGVSNFAAYVDYLHVWVQKHAECAAIAGNGSANVNEIEVKFLLHLVLRQKIGAQLEYRAQQGARPPTKHILEVNVLEATGPVRRSAPVLPVRKHRPVRSLVALGDQARDLTSAGLQERWNAPELDVVDDRLRGVQDGLLESAQEGRCVCDWL